MGARRRHSEAQHANRLSGRKTFAVRVGRMQLMRAEAAKAQLAAACWRAAAAGWDKNVAQKVRRAPS